MRQRLVIAALLGIWLGWRMWTARTGAKYQGSKGKTVRRMLEIAGVQPGEIVFDLGSGDGRVLIDAVRHFEADAVGIEIDPLRYIWSRVLAAAFGYSDRIQVHRGNLFDADLSEADVIVCFLGKRSNRKLELVTFHSIKPTARIVSNHHEFESLPLIATDERHSVHVYGPPIAEART